MKRAILIVLAFSPIAMAASCPARKPKATDTVIDRHTPGELQQSGRKGPACWQLVTKHVATGQLSYNCVPESVWRSHPVGSDAP